MVARAQQPAVLMIGLLHLVSSPGQNSPGVPALRRGLAEIGFVDGQNLSIEYRGSYDQSELPALAQELAHLPVSAIAALGGGVSDDAKWRSTAERAAAAQTRLREMYSQLPQRFEEALSFKQIKRV
jgi:hypothetical protein